MAVLPSIINVALIILGFSTALVVLRLIRGPSLPDRVVASDSLGANLIALIVVLSLKVNTPHYLDSVLVLAILGFLGTSAVAKFLVRSGLIDKRAD
jgi:multisubunit Na+/H+ antiporter MnhF subunit